jgi:hypothetical protein
VNLAIGNTGSPLQKTVEDGTVEERLYSADTAHHGGIVKGKN